MYVCVCVLAAQLCLTLFNPMDCSPSGSSLHGDSPGKNAGVGCHALLQGIFPTQGSNPGLLHCRQTVYRLSHQGSPRYCRNTLYTLFPVILTSPSKCIGSYDYYPYFTGKEAKTERKKKSRTYKVTGKEAEAGFTANSTGTKADVLNDHLIQPQDLQEIPVTDAPCVFEEMNKFVT